MISNVGNPLFFRGNVQPQNVRKDFDNKIQMNGQIASSQTTRSIETQDSSKGGNLAMTGTTNENVGKKLNYFA